jgi:hypothetical protein
LQRLHHNLEIPDESAYSGHLAAQCDFNVVVPGHYALQFLNQFLGRVLAGIDRTPLIQVSAELFRNLNKKHLDSSASQIASSLHAGDASANHQRPAMVRQLDLIKRHRMAQLAHGRRNHANRLRCCAGRIVPVGPGCLLADVDMLIEIRIHAAA